MFKFMNLAGGHGLALASPTFRPSRPPLFFCQQLLLHPYLLELSKILKNLLGHSAPDADSETRKPGAGSRAGSLAVASGCTKADLRRCRIRVLPQRLIQETPSECNISVSENVIFDASATIPNAY